MKLKLLRGNLFVLAVLSAGAIALAQGGPPPQRGWPGGPGGRRGGPGTFAFEGPGGGFGGKTVTGAPFTATVTITTNQTLTDGNAINHASTGTLARDSEGRTCRKMTLSALGPLRASGKTPHLAWISDPKGQTNYVLNDDAKTYEKFPMRQHGALGFRGRGRGKPGGDPSSGTTTESLGTKTIEGVNAEGTRITRTIPAGQSGNTEAIVITTERWYSPDLQLNIQETRTDPRFGTRTYRLTKINLSEPDASMFTVPTDYTVTQGRRFSRRPGGPAKPQTNQD